MEESSLETWEDDGAVSLSSVFERKDLTPNEVLRELDRGQPRFTYSLCALRLTAGLHSRKMGEQCEALTFFPKYFQSFPYPVQTTTALLKLGSLFKHRLTAILHTVTYPTVATILFGVASGECWSRAGST